MTPDEMTTQDICDWVVSMDRLYDGCERNCPDPAVVAMYQKYKAELAKRKRSRIY